MIHYDNIMFKFKSNTIQILWPSWILQTYNVTMYLVNSYQLAKISHVTMHYGSRSTGLGTTDWYRKAWPHTLPKLLLIQAPSHLSWQTSQTFGPCSRDDIEWVWAAWLHLATDQWAGPEIPALRFGASPRWRMWRATQRLRESAAVQEAASATVRSSWCSAGRARRSRRWSDTFFSTRSWKPNHNWGILTVLTSQRQKHPKTIDFGRLKQ